jgi:hypothetical protein
MIKIKTDSMDDIMLHNDILEKIQNITSKKIGIHIKSCAGNLISLEIDDKELNENERSALKKI